MVLVVFFTSDLSQTPNRWTRIVLTGVIAGLGLAITLLFALLSVGFQILDAALERDRRDSISGRGGRGHASRAKEQFLAASIEAMRAQPAGWYADPASDAWQRYWDGDAWTHNQIPATR